ncbi:MAG: ribosome maturation factor RimM [Bacteroidales bacterium]|nr:ribosome maturation factor RimM [Bacteroidales bacterium]
MIRKEEVFKIGVIGKPHGVKGEVSFAFTDDIFDRVDCDYLILQMDGILVPFFIEEYRFKTDTVALVKFEDIETAEQARRLTHAEVYFPKRYMEEQDEISSWSYFIGFRVEDVRHGSLGVITDVDESTMNVLFAIHNDRDEETLLPAHEEFILDVDHERKILRTDIPEGLYEMNN